MAETREVTYNAWGAFEHDRDLYALAYGRTVADLRGEIRARMDGDWNRMDRAGFWAMRKAELAAIVAEWATFERQNQREAVVTNVSDLTPAMREGLLDRGGLKGSTRAALVRRGLIKAGLTRDMPELTEAGERARDGGTRRPGFVLEECGGPHPTPTARKVGPANSSVGASARSVAFMLTGGAPPTAMTLSSIPSVLPNYNGYVRPWTASRRGSR